MSLESNDKINPLFQIYIKNFLNKNPEIEGSLNEYRKNISILENNTERFKQRAKTVDAIKTNIMNNFDDLPIAKQLTALHMGKKLSINQANKSKEKYAVFVANLLISTDGSQNSNSSRVEQSVDSGPNNDNIVNDIDINDTLDTLYILIGSSYLNGKMQIEDLDEILDKMPKIEDTFSAKRSWQERFDDFIASLLDFIINIDQQFEGQLKQYKTPFLNSCIAVRNHNKCMSVFGKICEAQETMDNKAKPPLKLLSEYVQKQSEVPNEHSLFPGDE